MQRITASQARRTEDKPRILIVEDESIIAWDLAVTLRDLGFEVVGIMASGEESIAAAANRHPDLVMMDICLKGPLNGLAAAEEIIRRQRIPVIFMTAYPDPGEKSGRCPWLSKPFDEAELERILRRSLPVVHFHQPFSAGISPSPSG